VDSVNSIQTRKTVELMTSQMISAPSAFIGMPACGHVSKVRVPAGMSVDVADLATRTYRGSIAWSPPNS
jgi:hypothetical protein